MSRSRNTVGPLLALLAIGAVIGGANAKPPSRIQGGRLATGEEFSGTVSLARPGNFIHTCNAGIIGPRHIITAAHCVENRASDDISIRAGIHDTWDSTNVVERLVTKVIKHPNYVPQTPTVAIENDIAILVLKDALPIGGRINAYRLPTQPPQELGSFHVAGWGNNEQNPTVYQHELKVLSMTLDSSRCAGSITNPTICAYSETGSTCSGDSGSPLIGGGAIYGIDSTGGCTIGGSTNFVNVYHYRSWINDIIAANP